MMYGKWTGTKIFENRQQYDNWLLGRKSATFKELEDIKNGITDVGIHYALEVVKRSDAGSPVAQIAPWYAGLIDDSSFTGLSNSDTMASHSGWIELTAYSEGSRQTLVYGAAASRAITASVSFTLSATKTIRGMLINSNNTKGGTTGSLWSTALYASPQTLQSGVVFTTNYSLTD